MKDLADKIMKLVTGCDRTDGGVPGSSYALTHAAIVKILTPNDASPLLQEIVDKWKEKYEYEYAGAMRTGRPGDHNPLYDGYAAKAFAYKVCITDLENFIREINK